MFLKKSSPTQQEFSSPKAYFGFNLDPSCNFPGIAVSLQTTRCCSGALGGFPAPLLPHTGERREDPARASHTCPNPGSPFILTTELCMSAEKENLCSCTETSPSSSSEKKKKKTHMAQHQAAWKMCFRSRDREEETADKTALTLTPKGGGLEELLPCRNSSVSTGISCAGGACLF